MPHEAGKHSHHHLGVDLHQIIRQSVDTSANLTSQWNCIPKSSKKGERSKEIRKERKIQRGWEFKNVFFLTWHCWFYHLSSALHFLLLPPRGTWPSPEQLHQSGQSLAGWCWSACPAENRKKGFKAHSLLISYHFTNKDTHLEAGDLCVLSILTQHLVDPVQDDLIYHPLSITQIRQNLNCVPGGL